MRRIGWVLLVVLVSAGFVMYAQTSANEMKMNGTICRSTCVSQVNGLSTCDPLCSDKSGDAVLVDDQGNIKKIANQDICMSHMGKRVKVTAVPSEKNREDTLRIMELYDNPGGGM